MDRPDQTTHFGFRDVPLGDKQTLVNEVFHSVAQRYDLMNDLMSVGLHRVWKDIMITRSTRRRATRRLRCSTSPAAPATSRSAPPRRRAPASTPPSATSIPTCSKSAAPAPPSVISTTKCRSSRAMPRRWRFPIVAFDAYTIAFGIRNVPQIDLALREAYRVLKPGSRFLCLEFSTVDVPGLDRIYDLFSFKVIPPLGRAVTGDAESYQYLVESIRKFPRPNAFAEMIRAAGFSRVKWESLSGGIVALHSGWRL